MEAAIETTPAMPAPTPDQAHSRRERGVAVVLVVAAATAAPVEEEVAVLMVVRPSWWG
jgi:hypothetical protein